MTAGVSLANDGQWESRCKEHLGENTVLVKSTCFRKRFGFKSGTGSAREVVIMTKQRGKKQRVIKKGEFPGQHID